MGAKFNNCAYTAYPTAPSNFDAWFTTSLGGLPAGAIAHIEIANFNAANDFIVGVREVGSSLERKVIIHEAEAVGGNFASFYVKLNSSSQYQWFLREATTGGIYTNIQVWVQGYWTGVDYTEKFDDITPTSSSSWNTYNAYTNSSVPKGRAVDCLMCNQADGAGNSLGVRTYGSALARYIQLHEAEGIEAGASTCAHWAVKVSDADGYIQTYSTNYADTKIYLMGYFGEEIDYQELAPTTLTIGVNDVWTDVDLTSYLDVDGRAADLFILNSSSNSYTTLGIRPNGDSSLTERDVHESESSYYNGRFIPQKTDSAGIVEFYTSNYSKTYAGIIGYYKLRIYTSDSLTATDVRIVYRHLNPIVEDYLGMNASEVVELMTHYREVADTFYSSEEVLIPYRTYIKNLYDSLAISSEAVDSFGLIISTDAILAYERAMAINFAQISNYNKTGPWHQELYEEDGYFQEPFRCNWKNHVFVYDNAQGDVPPDPTIGPMIAIFRIRRQSSGPPWCWACANIIPQREIPTYVSTGTTYGYADFDFDNAHPDDRFDVIYSKNERCFVSIYTNETGNNVRVRRGVCSESGYYITWDGSYYNVYSSGASCRGLGLNRDYNHYYWASYCKYIDSTHWKPYVRKSTSTDWRTWAASDTLLSDDNCEACKIFPMKYSGGASPQAIALYAVVGAVGEAQLKCRIYSGTAWGTAFAVATNMVDCHKWSCVTDEWDNAYIAWVGIDEYLADKRIYFVKLPVSGELGEVIDWDGSGVSGCGYTGLGVPSDIMGVTLSIDPWWKTNPMVMVNTMLDYDIIYPAPGNDLDGLMVYTGVVDGIWTAPTAYWKYTNKVSLYNYTYGNWIGGPVASQVIDMITGPGETKGLGMDFGDEQKHFTTWWIGGSDIYLYQPWNQSTIYYPVINILGVTLDAQSRAITDTIDSATQEVTRPARSFTITDSSALLDSLWVLYPGLKDITDEIYSSEFLDIASIKLLLDSLSISEEELYLEYLKEVADDIAMSFEEFTKAWVYFIEDEVYLIEIWYQHRLYRLLDRIKLSLERAVVSKDDIVRESIRSNDVYLNDRSKLIVVEDILESEEVRKEG